ncbi:MAG: hypothetical protein ACI4B5_02775 [Bacteroidaceae bacterium]
MKALKYICLSLVALTVVSCSDDDYKPGKPAAGGDTRVYFSDENESAKVVGLTEDTVYVTLVRTGNTANVLNVPVTLAGTKGIFSGAATANFAAGATETEYAIAISDKMEPFTNYKVQVIVDEAYTDPYTFEEGDLMPIIDLSIMREDYVPFAEGVYYSNFFGASWEDVLEYSPMLDKYRFSEWLTGYPMDFTWDRSTETNPDQVLGMSDKYITGYVHPTYGMVSAVTTDEKSVFCFMPGAWDDGSDVFYFGFKWTVSAGSFGIYADYFVVTDYIGGEE